MRRSALLVFSLALLASCTGAGTKTTDSTTAMAAPAAADPAAVRASIDATNATIVAAMNAGDVAAWTAAYAENAVTMMPTMPPVSGKPAIVQTLTEVLKTASFSNVSGTTSDVIVSGDLAVETGTFVATYTPKGGKGMVDTSKYVTVWQKQGDGSWKIIRDIFNTNIAAKQ